MVTVAFRCENELNRAIRIEAARRDQNRSEFILDALAEKLARIEAEQPTNGQIILELLEIKRLLLAKL